MAEKPSFLRSTLSGIAGFVDGVIAGGLVGAAGGAVAGLLYALVTGDLANAGTIVANGAVFTGALMGSVGGMAGAMTGVVKSRETGAPSAQDVTNAVNIAFAQGVGVGHNMAVEQVKEEASTRFRDQIAAERARAATQSQTRT